MSADTHQNHPKATQQPELQDPTLLSMALVRCSLPVLASMPTNTTPGSRQCDSKLRTNQARQPTRYSRAATRALSRYCLNRLRTSITIRRGFASSYRTRTTCLGYKLRVSEAESLATNVVVNHNKAALITKYKGPEMEKPVIRPYTPVNDEGKSRSQRHAISSNRLETNSNHSDARGYIEFVIKRYPEGPMSQHLHSMTPGQRLDFKGPIPKYAWSPNKHEHIVLIAGGTGITPMYQLARTIFKNPNDQTKVTLVFGNIGEEDILLRKEFDALENTYPRRFRAFYTLDNPPEEWQQGKGYVTKELLKTVMPEPKEGDKIKIFVCGPPGMYKSISGTKKSATDQGELNGILKELGYDKEQVYKF